VFLAQSEWMLKIAKDDYPEITFHFNSEFKTAKALV
jgi:peptide chain release factor 3